MPKQSRIRRFRQWLNTLCRSMGALFRPRNMRHALLSVTKNRKEYVCFYIAALAVSTGFWVIGLCTEANLHDARVRTSQAYDYHVEVALLNNEQYANLDNYLSYELSRDNPYLERYEWVNGGKPYSDGTYSVRLTLNESDDLELAYREVQTNILNRVTRERREIRFSPLYTFEQDFVVPYQIQFRCMSAVWLLFSILVMLVLFLIRLDHFRFVYGIYMTFGADFPHLIGAAGGELLAILLITALPAALIGIGVAAFLYVPVGVGLHITARAVLTAVFGGFLAVLVSVWFPMRRLSKQPPVCHLATEDNGGLVSSPRRSFHLFGETFPGKYELYGFWRMRKYYLRLLISAVLFASVFVSGLYIADMVTAHNDRDDGEYIVAYRPDAYYDALLHAEGLDAGEPETDEDGATIPGWILDDEEVEMIWTDFDVFYEDLLAIPGVSYALWDTSVSGGEKLAHLLLKPGQLHHASSYTVESDERASEGYRWATNRYDYVAVDRLWIDNMIENGLCTFEGDPYRVLSSDHHIIISEDIYNKQAFDFSPGDTILVAVCVERAPTELTFDPKELLRNQIDAYTFRYEAYTVAAVAHGLDSEEAITLGVTPGDFCTLTDAAPVRQEMTVYMENGTDIATVTAAERTIRSVLAPFSDWTVEPTYNYFDAQVRGLKNDHAVILTLAVCLLIISPLVWYFSQIMFYRKRRREFAILRALGAPDSSFARLHRMAGGILSGAAFLVTTLMALLCNYLVYFTVNTLLPMMHLTESIHYEFRLSPIALMACVLVSVLCGFLSCELPYRLYARRELQSGAGMIDL